jgi:hypothetical protein
MCEYTDRIEKLSDLDRGIVEHFLKHGDRRVAFQFMKIKSSKYNMTRFFNRFDIKRIIHLHKTGTAKEAVKIMKEQGYDLAWVQSRLAVLADFNIQKFLTKKDGIMYYDFSKATDQDWYCISEYTADAVVRDDGLNMYPAINVKIKANCKMKAIELMGKTIGAFTDKIEHAGAVSIHFDNDFGDDDEEDDTLQSE